MQAVAEQELLDAGFDSACEDESRLARDALSGSCLNEDEVREARREEMAFVRRISVFEEATLEECWQRTGRGPISTKWVDVDKGSEIRSRWVARDFKPKGEKDRADLFAAMPPLEAKKLLFRRFASKANRDGPRKMKLMFIDVKKAHLNGVCERDDVYVELPSEAGAPGKCGRLLRWLYGMREAAQAWGAYITNEVEERRLC